jgi:predicted component of type VI protein secretion system
MRKNTQAVWQAWQAGKALRKCDAVWTDGKHVWSYGTCIAALDSDDRVVLNRTRYSVTTTVQQTGMAVLMQHVSKREVYNKPLGASPEKVLV